MALPYIEFRVPKSSPNIPHDIVLPRFFAEHKKPVEPRGKPLNQLRMYLAAAVKFLAALEIYEFPVYGLVTEGKIGRVIMAWMSKDTKVM